MITSVTEQNKQIVKHFFDAINRKEMKQASELLNEDLDWWIIGKTRVSGSHDKRNIMVGFKMLHREFENLQFILHEFTAEGDRVSVTAESKGLHPNGKIYNNHYHFLFTIKNEKIFRAKEYLDTELATWIQTP
ncbi:hypothetical protein CH373_14855 [Leptospira perolatii]|uniref:SnoaL-like domain-containing protein n=1 Tax=Leptospira perolatii TaxID=2023191 RepID=A0A2M9ZKG4_9LEPT|nr:nuclear transport factor 2 family protein [Leptospira perolatii]PJZ69195.1 hypothetical protein CH360_11765 [Leptospira perolatii]PJZ72423.1 hypothetical protein CH373_14855 [Leptospira perolatii]